MTTDIHAGASNFLGRVFNLRPACLLAIAAASLAAGGCATHDLADEQRFTYKTLPPGEINWHDSRARWNDVWHGDL